MPKPNTTAGGVAIRCHFDKLVRASELTPHDKNTKIHPPEKVLRIRRLIRKAGHRRAVVVSKLSGKIVKGHCRWKGALNDDDDELPVEYQQYRNKAEELADLAADNFAADGSDDDEANLLDIVRELGGIECDGDILGMEPEEFAKILEHLDPDKKAPAPKREKSRNYNIEFDDATQKEAWLAFLARLKADMPEQSIGERLMEAIARAER